MSDANTGMAGRLLRVAGLAPAAQVTQLHRDAAAARRRIDELTAALDRAREENATLRSRLEAARTHAEARQTAEQQKTRERADKFERKMTEAAARLTERDADRTRRLGEIRERMAFAEQSTRQAREQLMAIDVKLDILEGAITVLDTRTRAVLAAKATDRP